MFATWRHFVNDEVQSSDSATWRKKLPTKGALHVILLKVQCTNGATSGRGVNIFDVVDNIEVYGNGTEVLFSLYPREFEKWYETLTGRGLTLVEDQAASAVQEGVFPILFGRETYDPEFFLNLDSFQDVQIEVTYSPSISADGGFATGTTKIDLMLLVSEDTAGLAYQGTLVTRRLYTYTTAASGTEEVALPSNSVIRHIGNYCYEAGVADGSNVTKVVLEDKDSGNKLFEADWDDLLHANREMFGADVSHYAKLFLTNNETWNSRIGEILHINVEMEETADATNDEVDMVEVDDITGDKLTFDLFNVDITAGAETITASSTDRVIRVEARGKSPSYFGLIPFDYGHGPAAWLNTANFGSPTVIHTEGNAGATAYVSIQELRRF